MKVLQTSALATWLRRPENNKAEKKPKERLGYKRNIKVKPDLCQGK
jgi:hypothetical protein